MPRYHLHVEHRAEAVQWRTLIQCMLLLLLLMLGSSCIAITQYHCNRKQAFTFVSSQLHHRQKCGCCSSKSDWHGLCHPKATGEF